MNFTTSGSAKPALERDHLKAAQELAQHLRDRPEDLALGGAQLAERFQLPRPFVDQVIQQVSQRRRQNNAAVLSRPIDIDQPIRSAFVRVFCWFKEFIKKLTDSPSRFVGITTGATMAVVVVGVVVATRFSPLAELQGTSLAQARSLVEAAQLGGNPGALEAAKESLTKLEDLQSARDRVILNLNIFLFAVLLGHLVAYYRHALARNALVGTGIVAAIFITGTSLVVLLTPSAREEPLLARLVMSLVGGMMLSMLYCTLGVLAAVAGGYARIRREDRQMRALTRQQLLERLFEIQAKMEAGAATPSTTSKFWETAWVRQAQKRIYALAGAASLAFSAISTLVSIAIWNTYQIRSVTEFERMPLVYVVSMAALSLIQFAMLISVGFLARRPMRAILVGLVSYGASYLPTLIAYRGLGHTQFAEYMQPQYMIQGGVFTLVMMLVGSFGAVVEERAERSRKLHESDPATLLAEMLQIQWRLAVKPSRVCVMVVDAVKSSLMKASSDPLVVEWSFREYQKWIEEIVTPLGGRVYKTMGDGAVVQFENCYSAFRAAQRLQTQVDSLNRDRNRLKMPFRLRIGLHIGHVEGDLETVEFTEVIDIAAHVEKIAPIGSIAMTELVAQDLTDEQLVPLKDPVDGHSVYVAVQSRVDA